MNNPTVLITGASAGIGAMYADRFARRGHDVVLVARDQVRLDELARRLTNEFGVSAEVLSADLTDPAELEAVADRLRHDERIGVLVNNAGITAPGAFTSVDPARTADLIALNVVAPTRLTAAVVPRLTAAGGGAVVTVGSMVGLIPEYGQALYGATKAYLQYLSESLHHELLPQGVYVQAVLPAATRTGIFERSGRDAEAIPGMMDAGDMVDAALVGYDAREAVTMPSVPEEARWTAFHAARAAIADSAAHSEPAARYRQRNAH